MADTWTSEEADPVAAAIAPPPGQMRASTPMPAPMPPSPRGQLPGGRADFRGFPLTQATAVCLVDVDFTGARAPKNRFGVRQTIQLREVVAERSVFDRAGAFHRIQGQFRECSFRRITTSSCSVTGTFTDCDFSGANFQGAHFAARFIRCRFEGCNLHVASWPSHFEDCEFAGARIHNLFADVRAAAMAGARVTFTVTMSRVIPGGDAGALHRTSQPVP